MQYSHRLGLIAGALALTSAIAVADNALAPAAAPASAPVAAPQAVTVNGTTIGADKFEFLVKEMTANGMPDSPELRENVRKQLVTSLILAQEAMKNGVDKQPDVAARMELMQQSILARAQVMAWLKANPITEAQIKAKYEERKEAQTTHEIKARHILVKTEAQARKLLAELKKGKKFEELAKKHSEDPGSKGTGGDLGWGDPNAYVPEFSEALKQLENGQISPTPVKTQYGFHIIQKQDERRNAPPLEQLKPQIQRELEGEMVEKYIESLRAKAVIK